MNRRWLILILAAGVLLGLGFYLYRAVRPSGGRSLRLGEWIRNPSSHPTWLMTAGTRCRTAPFVFPTDGMIGYLWDDSFRPGHRHSGVDIFSGTEPGRTRVVAAYSGYLTRLPEWKSALILRIPSDPLDPGRQIWLYYTHMADPNGNSYISSEFPAGTNEKFVKAGTLLGFQGDYTGDADAPTGVHLHFSIVRDDGQGHFMNELLIRNTYDPSPYFGLTLNGKTAPDEVITCDGGL